MRRVLCLTCICAWFVASSASAQTSAEAQGVWVRGGDSVFAFKGLAGGGGVLFRNRVGVEGELGMIGDNSDERTLAPVLSIGGSLRLATPHTAVPFVAAGFTRLGDSGGWYVGGGANIWVHRRTAIHLELRETVWTKDYFPCSMNARNQCDLPPNAWFLRAGVTVAFGTRP